MGNDDNAGALLPSSRKPGPPARFGVSVVEESLDRYYKVGPVDGDGLVRRAFVLIPSFNLPKSAERAQVIADALTDYARRNGLPEKSFDSLWR